MFWVLVWLTDCLIDCKAPKKPKKKKKQTRRGGGQINLQGNRTHQWSGRRARRDPKKKKKKCMACLNAKNVEFDLQPNLGVRCE